MKMAFSKIVLLFFFTASIFLVSQCFCAEKKGSADRKLLGNPPVITVTSWGQKVQHDIYTLIEMEKYNRFKQGQDWEKDGEVIAKEITAKSASGKIVVEKPPTRILNGLWVLTADGQQRTYLIDTGAGLLLIDPSYDKFVPEIIKQTGLLGYSEKEIKWVLFTHCHLDHAQSAPYWQKKGKQLLIHSADLNPIKTGNEITAWWLLNDDRGYFKPVEGKIRTFEDGDCLKFSDTALYVIHTPGHTPGSCCFYLNREGKNILVSEDIVLHNGRHAWMGNPYADWEQYLKSLWKLKRYAAGGHGLVEKPREPVIYDILLPGHGTISLDNAERDLDKTIEVVSEIINRRLQGDDIEWINPYQFFWEREQSCVPMIKIQYR